MAKKEFQAESKRLLELMIHSIYTHKEIFLRELISNASDATDKRYYQQVQSGKEAFNRNDLPIQLHVDKEARTLTITDHGIGMTEAELEKNLGTIAQSGSGEFKAGLEPNEDIDIIGQFGVGFYSAFMVADKVVVTSLTDGGNAYRWESDGIDGYTITPASKEAVGTTITLTIKPNTETEQYDEFLDPYSLQALVKKHSDYIRYPIQMELEKSRPVEGKEDEYETYEEIDTLNSMTPIWKRAKTEVTEEDYNHFYKEKFYDYEDPQKTIYTSTEGAATYNALLFIPAHAPMNYHSKEYQKGLQLYVSGVLIMEHCADLLPDYFGFVRGVVDSQDLSLNISREMLQHDRQLAVIAKRLEKKIQAELLAMQKNDREAYETFFRNFGVSLKYGVQEGYGANKDLLQDLLLFHSSQGGMTTLKEYRDRMPEAQPYIYFVSGDNLAQLENLPATEIVKEKGYEILYFTESIDEFAIRMLHNYEEKEFRSVVGGELGLETEEEKKELEEQEKNAAELLTKLQEVLDGKVAEVKISSRLKNHAVCLTTKGEITLEMERTFAHMPGAPAIKAERVLELNAQHPIFAKLEQLYETDQEQLKTYAQVLYDQALLLEGMPIEDPVAYTDAVNQFMV